MRQPSGTITVKTEIFSVASNITKYYSSKHHSVPRGVLVRATFHCNQLTYRDFESGLCIGGGWVSLFGLACYYWGHASWSHCLAYSWAVLLDWFVTIRLATNNLFFHPRIRRRLKLWEMEALWWKNSTTRTGSYQPYKGV